MKRRTRKRETLEQLVGGAATPVFLVSADRRLAYFNAGCEQLTGWTAEEVVGQLCEYVTSPGDGTVESLAACLCPPAAVFEGRFASVPAYLPCRHGEPLARLVNFVPLPDEAGLIAAVLGLVGAVDPPEQFVETGPAEELHAELAALRNVLRRRFGTTSLICRSDGMLRVAEQLAIAKQTKAAVLISGEPGSGKEHVARAIHYESEWRTRSFVPLDCRRLSPLDLQQTLNRLFEPSGDGEFSASVAALRPGTVFLSHVEHLPRDLQKAIVEAFRALREKRGELRLMASTTVELRASSDDDCLRSDFYHLLTPLCIAVPPLRRRTEDLRYLGQHLLEELNRGDTRQFNGFADDVWDKILDYNWPGNVDELLAVIREARATCDGPLIRLKDLPFRFRTGLDAQAIGPVIRPQVSALEPLLAQTEKTQIERALHECRHNKSKAAQVLGMTRPRLYRRMQILGIQENPEPS